SRRRHTRSKRDWSSDVCSSDLSPALRWTVGDRRPCGRRARRSDRLCSRWSPLRMSARCLSTGSSQNRSSTISILTYYRPPRSNAEGGGRTPLIVLSARRRDRLERRTLRLELGDRVGLTQGEPDVVESLHQPPTRVVVDLERDGDVPRGHGPGCQVHGQLHARL